MMIPPLDLAKLNQQLADWCAHIMEAEPTIADPERRAQLRQSLKQIQESQSWLNANYRKELDAIAAREKAVQQQLAEGEERLKALQAEAARLEAAPAPPPVPPAPPPIDPQLGFTLRKELFDRYAPKDAGPQSARPTIKDFSAEYNPTASADIVATTAPPSAVWDLPDAVVAGLLQLARVNSQDVVYHLGCGDGRVLISAASRFQAKGVGVDADKALVIKAGENVRKARLQSMITVKQGNPPQEDCTRASVVVVSLTGPAKDSAGLALRRQLSPGIRVVSADGPIAGWPADRNLVVTDDTGRTHRLHLWEISPPADSSIGGSSEWTG